MKPSVYGLTYTQLEKWVTEQGEKRFRAEQMWHWLYQQRCTQFSDMKNVNQTSIEHLQDQFVIQSMTEKQRQESADGTVKFLFSLQDGNVIETVLMRQKYGLTVCVTTQVGCNIGCSFCASGLLKKNRDLVSGEIVEQIVRVQHYLDEAGQGERVGNVVVMGIGEPFDNYDHLLDFLYIINHDKGLAIGARHITVSTSGLANRIRDFAHTGLQVNLAISLHAPNNELRTRIMKINRAIPLEELMAAVHDYLAHTNRRIMFEYIMLKDVNDGQQEALQLADLLGDIRHLAFVNLIPYNPVDEHDQYQRSTKETVLAFYDTLKKKGIQCGIRQEHGTDIDAACGQLRSKQLKKAQ